MHLLNLLHYCHLEVQGVTATCRQKHSTSITVNENLNIF